jgi:lipoprotein-anchoring transpeptidase ErfK/SrfK
MVEVVLTKSVGAVPAAHHAGLSLLRSALVSGVAFSLLAALTSSAQAYPYRIRYYAPGSWQSSPMRYHHRISHSRRDTASEPKKDVGFGEMPKGPLQLMVNIGTQKVTLYSNGVRVAQGPVSTGMPGHPTPMGVFSIIEKDRYHHSNIYSGAPMPFMERITWSGVALHEGVLPGHPASHGCIRTSHDFAQRLWPLTKLGVRFIVARAEVVPVEFEHPKLFGPKQKPKEPQIAMNATDGAGSQQIRFAQAVIDPNASERAIDSAPIPGPATRTTETPQLKPADDVRASAPTPQINPAASVEAVKAAEPPPATQANDDSRTGTVQSVPGGEIPAGLPASELRKSVETPPATEKATAAPAAAEPARDDELAKPAPTIDPPKPVAPARTKSADQPVKRTGQVAVFVSRKEKKIFVRQGMVPLFDMPITIDDPDQPLGTHVFTFMSATDEAVRWNLMTIPTDAGYASDQPSRRRGREAPKPVVQAKALKSPSTAAEALDRIAFPSEAIDRISELLIPGSSLVVSDEGLGRETGRGTEFIVLTR